MLIVTDVYPNNSNLLATAGDDKTIKIFDRRESKIVKIIDSIHEGDNYNYYLVLGLKMIIW